MISYRFTPRVPRLWLKVLPLFVLAACTNPGSEATKKKIPAEITLPVHGSLQGFQEIEKALAKFDWGPAHDAPCPGCQSPGEVTIRYTGMTKDIKPGNGPAKLRIVALIQNHSNEDVEHTPSGTTFKANTKYLMWVHSRNSKTIWGFIELGDGYDPNPKPIGLLEACSYKTPSPTDDADFKNCGDPHTSSTSSGWIKPAYAATRMDALISKSGWIACDPDCCTGTTKSVY